MLVVDFGSLLILTYIFTARLREVRPVAERAALAFALALGLKSLMVYALIVLGVRPDRWVQTSFSIAALYGGALWVWLRKRSPSAPTPVCGNPSPVSWLPFTILSSLVLLSLVNALYFPIAEVDGIWYQLRGKVFFHEVRFDSDTLNAQFRQYPPMVPLLHATLYAFDIAGAKILFPLLYLCLLILFFFGLERLSKSRKQSAVFTLILASTPYFWWHSTLPFLDLTTAFYFSIGALYWFSLIQKEGEADCATARLSGLFFGLAAWNRPEFLLYGFIPLAIWIFVLHRDETLGLQERRRLLWAFALPLLALPTLWLGTLLGFESALERRIPALAAACAAQWLGVGIVSCTRLPLERLRPGWMAVAGFLLFLTVIVFFGPQSVSAGKALAIAFSRTLSVQIFYSFSVFLVLLLWLERGAAWPPSLRWLGMFLIAYLGVHFMLFAYSEPRWTEMGAFVEATFRSPGNSVNLSDTRGMMAWYPVFLFFISRFASVRRAFDAA